MEEITRDSTEVESPLALEEIKRLSALTEDSPELLLTDTRPVDFYRTGQTTGEIRHPVHSGRLSRQASLLRKKLMTGLSRYADLPEKYIEIFSGTGQSFESILKAFCQPGDELLVCGPKANEFHTPAEKYGVQVAYHHGFSPFSADPEGIVEKLCERTKLIYLGNPNSTTGTVYSQHEIKYILERPGEAFLIIEEAYFEYLDSGFTELVREYDNLIIIRSFSHTRSDDSIPFSYMLAGQKTQQALMPLSHEVKSSALVYAAALIMLKDLDCAKRHAEVVRESMIYLSVRLWSLGVSCRITPADFLLIKVANPEAVVSRLSQAGINACDISRLPQLDNYISVVVENDALSLRTVEAFERMPGQYYVLRRVPSTKITLRRGPEAEMEDHHEKNMEVEEKIGKM